MKIVFMGTPAAAVPTLAALIESGHEVAAVYTQPDRPAGRGKRLRQSAVKEFAVERRLTVVQPERIKTAEALEEFRAFQVDVAIVVAYGRILPETFLNAFPKGALNLHFSLLPKYRGAAPVNWAIANGESETGVTVMKMDAGLDTGDILLQHETTIGDNETATDLIARLALLGAEKVVEVLADFDSFEGQSQNHDAATYAPIMRKSDGLIDWSMSSQEIANHVRGFQPFPTAFTMFRGLRLAVWQASAADHRGTEATVLAAKADELIIGCGEGALRIDELQLEGKRRQNVRDFLNGVKLDVGEKLG